MIITPAGLFVNCRKLLLHFSFIQSIMLKSAACDPPAANPTVPIPKRSHMKSIRLFLDRLIPQWARRPLLCVLFFNLLVYYIPKFLEPYRTLHKVSTHLDRLLPCVPFFVLIYVLAYVQWVTGFVVIARDSPERCRRVFSGDLISMALVLIFFLIWPTTMDRAPAAGTGFFPRLLAFIYSTDTPTNLFPSLHCLQSWLCFRGAIGLRRMPKVYTWVQLVFALLVFASVVLTKQHIWPDILGGIAFAEAGQGLARLLRAERMFGKTESKARESS